MTKKIGVSLPDELYEWAAGAVEDGRADSVSGLIADCLQARRARDELESLVADLAAELGEPDEERKTKLEEILQAADKAYQRHLLRKASDAV
jgi:Arc/MetJ-type ribon-helix-helix transcriptional regulator